MKSCIDETEKLWKVSLANAFCYIPIVQAHYPLSGFSFVRGGPIVQTNFDAAIANTIVWEVYCSMQQTRTPSELYYKGVDPDISEALKNRILAEARRKALYR